MLFASQQLKMVASLNKISTIVFELSQILVVPCVFRIAPPDHSSDVALPVHFPRVLTPILLHRFCRRGIVLEEIRAKRR